MSHNIIECSRVVESTGRFEIVVYECYRIFQERSRMIESILNIAVIDFKVLDYCTRFCNMRLLRYWIFEGIDFD